MVESSKILLDLLVVFIAAKAGGEIAERLRQPPVVGEVILGILVGSGVFDLVGHSPAVAVVSTIGAIVLLFLVGLETDLEAIRKIGFRATIVAALGVLFPFALGFVFMLIRGAPTIQSLFLATALVATSVGITARVLSDFGVLNRVESQIILAAAVVDDLLSLLVLSMVTAVAKAGAIPATDLALTIGKGALFIVAAAVLPSALLNRHGFHLQRLRHRNSLLSVAIASCIGFSLLAEYFGLATIVGAFLAGLGFANVKGHEELRRDISSIADFLAPLFFVAIGMLVDIRSIVSPPVLLFGVVVLILAIAGKFVGCTLGAVRLGWRSALIVGVGMVPRGEVGLIVAAIGKSLGVIPDSLVGTIVMVSVLTTIIVPPLLPPLFRRADDANAAEAA